MGRHTCMNRERFLVTPHILTYKDQPMMVVVESRRAFCWPCKQLGHLAKFCLQKSPSTTNNNNSNRKDKSTSPITKPVLEPGDHRAVRRRNGPRSPGKRNIHPKLQHQKPHQLQKQNEQKQLRKQQQ